MSTTKKDLVVAERLVERLTSAADDLTAFIATSKKAQSTLKSVLKNIGKVSSEPEVAGSASASSLLIENSEKALKAMKVDLKEARDSVSLLGKQLRAEEKEKEKAKAEKEKEKAKAEKEKEKAKAAKEKAAEAAPVKAKKSA